MCLLMQVPMCCNGADVHQGREINYWYKELCEFARERQDPTDRVTATSCPEMEITEHIVVQLRRMGFVTANNWAMLGDRFIDGDTHHRRGESYEMNFDELDAEDGTDLFLAAAPYPFENEHRVRRYSTALRDRAIRCRRAAERDARIAANDILTRGNRIQETEAHEHQIDPPTPAVPMEPAVQVAPIARMGTGRAADPQITTDQKPEMQHQRSRPRQILAHLAPRGVSGLELPEPWAHTPSRTQPYTAPDTLQRLASPKNTFEVYDSNGSDGDDGEMTEVADEDSEGTGGVLIRGPFGSNPKTYYTTLRRDDLV